MNESLNSHDDCIDLPSFNPKSLSQLISVAPSRANSVYILVEDFIKRWPNRVRVAHDMAKTGSLEHAIRELHTLRGSCGAVGGERLGQITLTVERALAENGSNNLDSLFNEIHQELSTLTVEAESWLSHQKGWSHLENEVDLPPEFEDRLLKLFNDNDMEAYDLFQRTRDIFEKRLSDKNMTDLDEAVSNLNFRKAVEILNDSF